MAVDSVSGYNYPFGTAPSASEQGGAAKAGSGEVSKSDFLQLLVAQLKNQDPLNPVKNEDFVAQLATFSSLEQLIDIRSAVNKLAGITAGDGETSTSS